MVYFSGTSDEGMDHMKTDNMPSLAAVLMLMRDKHQDELKIIDITGISSGMDATVTSSVRITGTPQAGVR